MAAAAMVQTTAFLPYILPKAPGVSVLMAEFQARQAAIEFCARTRAWRHEVSQAIATNEPVIVCPDYAAIHDIERANFATADAPASTRQLTAIQFSDLPPAWASDASAPPATFSQIIPNRVVLYPFAAGTLTMTVYLKPRPGQDYTLTATPMTDYFNQVPDFIAEQHAEAIAYGALSRILALPKKPYTDPAMAGVFKMMFDTTCDALFDTNKKGQQRAPRRNRYNDF